MTEHALQNQIRNALAGKCVLFRVNVGTGWTGDVARLNATDVLIRNARPFSTGLPAGFTDTFGLVTFEITEGMVGQRIAQPVFGEVKTATGRVSPKQEAFLQAMSKHGARANVWRSVEDALNTIHIERFL